MRQYFDANARATLRVLDPESGNWVPDHPGIDRNVVIVGGGQTGTVFAFALRRAGVCKVTVIDSAADKASAGICAKLCAREKVA